MEKEIKDHAVKAYKTVKDPHLKFWHKVGEIAIEVGIIVFAVTLSIWVHDVSDHNHEQKDVKSFLLGVRQDLKADLIQMREDTDAFRGAGLTFSYITTNTPGFKLSKDSINKYQSFLSNTTSFVGNDGRYQGFKSSGKLGNIEDDALQNDIVELYQAIIPSILASTDGYNQRKDALFTFLNKNLKRTGNGTNNLLDILSTDEAINICGTLTYTGEINARYKSAIDKSKKIIKEINADYDLK
jgi:hypothetical protein